MDRREFLRRLLGAAGAGVAALVGVRGKSRPAVDVGRGADAEVERDPSIAMMSTGMGYVLVRERVIGPGLIRQPPDGFRDPMLRYMRGGGMRRLYDSHTMRE